MYMYMHMYNVHVNNTCIQLVHKVCMPHKTYSDFVFTLKTSTFAVNVHVNMFLELVDVLHPSARSITVAHHPCYQTRPAYVHRSEVLWCCPSVEPSVGNVDVGAVTLGYANVEYVVVLLMKWSCADGRLVRSGNPKLMRISI